MMNFAKARETMVDRQIRTMDVTDPRILDAMGEVPRELFLPAGLRPLAYSDADLPLRVASWGETPRYLPEAAMFARLVQLAGVREEDIVLDVGCATGYSSAVLARLANSVVAVESEPDLANQATETLIDLDIGNVAVVSGPLEDGYPGEAPYDVIVVEGAVEMIPAALTSQLKDGGRLVVVIGLGPAGVATVFTRSGEEISHRPAFNAPLPALPGFAVTRTFVF